MTNKVRLSVIMPTYNSQESYLRRAIDSVLAQTFSNFEFIIIDDGSEANDIEIVESYDDPRIKLIKNKHSGIANTLNTGIENAKGEYIARMDSDDICFANRFKEEIEFLDKNKNITMVSCYMQSFGSRRQFIHSGTKNCDEFMAKLFLRCVVSHPSVMIRREFLVSNNLEYRNVKAEDYDLWTRVMQKGKIDELHKVLMHYRVHAKQLTVSRNFEIQDSTNRVRFNLLKQLSINPTGQELKLHGQFCEGQISTAAEINELAKWVLLILEKNQANLIYNNKAFSKIILRQYGYIILRETCKGKTSITTFFKNKVSKRYGVFKIISYALSESFYHISMRIPRAKKIK